MAHYGPEEWFYANGALAANQRAAVFGPGNDNTYAPIFSDAGLTVPLANPTTTDANGLLEFYAPDGQYWVFVGPEATGDSVLVTLGASPDNPVLSVNGIAPDGAGDVELTASDVGAQPIATINAAGDLYIGTGDNATTRLPIGSPGEVLTVVAGTASWEPGGGGAVDSVNGQTGVVVLDAGDVGADPAGSAAAAQAAAIAASQPIATINAAGDLYIGTGNDATTRLPIGSPGEVLTVVAGTASWEPAPADAVDSVNGQTGVVVLDAGDVGADPAGSAAAAAAASQPLATIDATGDLYIGTGDNTTTRLPIGSPGEVLTVVAGTASWEPAPADAVDSVNGQTGVVVLDSSDVGAQPIATITQKGGIYVGTGAATVIELPPGTNGDVLSSNSAEPSGLEWVASSSGGYLPYSVAPRANEYFQASGVITVRSSKAPTLNVMYLYPTPVQFATTLTGVAWENTAAVPTALVRLGLYAASGSNGVGALIADFGTFTNDTATVIAAVVSQALGSAGLYWLAWVPQTIVANCRHGAGWNPYVGSTSFPNGTGTGWNNCYFQAGVSGALPASVTIGGSTDAPVVGVKYA